MASRWHSRGKSPALHPVAEAPPLIYPEKQMLLRWNVFHVLWEKEAKLFNIEVLGSLGFLGMYSQQLTLKNFRLCFIWRPG